MTGIALALVGGTVASGMGLSLMHDVLYENPTPVRAAVVGHTPAVMRATAAAVAPVETVEPAAVRTVSLDVASFVPDDAGTQTNVAPANVLDGKSLDPSPFASLRPQIRSTVKDVQTVALEPAVRRSVPNQATSRSVVARANIAPIIRSVPLPVEDRPLAQRTLIGVYR